MYIHTRNTKTDRVSQIKIADLLSMGFASFTDSKLLDNNDLLVKSLSASSSRQFCLATRLTSEKTDTGQYFTQ